MQTSVYLQEVLLLMLASKPVLVSAKSSVNGKFSKNTETMTFMHLNPVVEKKLLSPPQSTLQFYRK